MTRDEMRQKWLDALRSGKYKQGKNHLQAGDEFCCLGVACHVLEKDLYITVNQKDGLVTYDGWSCVAPECIVEALGLHGVCGDPVDYPKSLTELNDEEGFTFEQIADELETGKYWEE